MIMKRNEDDAPEQESDRDGVFAIDWLEYRAVVSWEGYRFNRWYTKLEDLKRKAKEYHVDELPIQIGQQQLLLAARGMGSGRQSHFEYLFKIGPILFAVSGRESDNLKHPNLYVKLTGEACLVYGVTQCRNIVDQVVAELGGGIVDDGVSRIDLCLDVPELSLNDGLQQAVESGQLLGSLLTTQENLSFYGNNPRTGFRIGNPRSILLRAYDKLTEARKKPGLYHNAMMRDRWNGCEPTCATRIEYQIARGWLRRYGIVRVDGVLERLADIVHKITSPTQYPLFVVTETVPDRQNKNQQRAGVHPEWQWIIETFSQLAGKPQGPLEAVPRGSMQLKRLYTMARGYLTAAAAQLGMFCESPMDGCNVLLRLAEDSEEASDEWSQSFTSKSIKAGTYQDLTSFEFGTLSEPPEESEGDFE